MRHFLCVSILGWLFGLLQPATASTFDYVQVSYIESDAFELSLKGPQLDISKSFAENYFLAASYGDFSADVNGFDVDSEMMLLRAGFKKQSVQNPSFTGYAGIEAIRMEYTYMTMGENDSGVGGFAGARNMITDELELKIEVKYNQVFDDSNFSGEIGLRYLVTPWLSLTASATEGSFKGYQVGAAYHF